MGGIKKKYFVELQDWETNLFPIIAEWRGYDDVNKWMEALLEQSIDVEVDDFYDEHPNFRVAPVFKKGRKHMVYVLMYLGAIVLANLLVARFGPSITIINAFVLIGLDLTARDQLHEQWRNDKLVLKMAVLIAAGSVITILMNRDATQIAIASFVAFAGAATVDTIVYQLLGHYPRWLRVNGSNIPSAAVDSIAFPTLAFGGFLPLITLGQFAAKVGGGFLWSLVFRWLDLRQVAE